MYTYIFSYLEEGSEDSGSHEPLGSALHRALHNRPVARPCPAGSG